MHQQGTAPVPPQAWASPRGPGDRASLGCGTNKGHSRSARKLMRRMASKKARSGRADLNPGPPGLLHNPRFYNVLQFGQLPAAVGPVRRRHVPQALALAIGRDQVHRARPASARRTKASQGLSPRWIARARVNLIRSATQGTDQPAIPETSQSALSVRTTRIGVIRMAGVRSQPIPGSVSVRRAYCKPRACA